MKYLINIRWSGAFLFALCFACASSCSSKLTFQEALEKNRREFESREQRDDAEFLVEAQSLNLLLLALDDLALERGYSAALVDMVRENRKDHEKVASDLSKLERRKDVSLPTEMSAEHQRSFEEAEEADRTEFDRDLVRILKYINRENEYKYENEAKEAHDDDIRSFAARRLGMFDVHEKRLDKVEDGLLRTN